MTQTQMRLLLLGDENLTFTEDIISNEKFKKYRIEVGLHLSLEEIEDKLVRKIEVLAKQDVRFHYGVNSTQLRNCFSTHSFDRMLYILPGLAFHGCPKIIDPLNELFRLRLHLYGFSVLKSGRPIIKESGDVWILWADRDEKNRDVHRDDNESAIGPKMAQDESEHVSNEGDEAKAQNTEVKRVENNTDKKDKRIRVKTKSDFNFQEETAEDSRYKKNLATSSTTPFRHIFPSKLGKFCNLIRTPEDDVPFVPSEFPEWRPLVQNFDLGLFELPLWMEHAKFITFRPVEKPGRVAPSGETYRSPSEEFEKCEPIQDNNVLKVPQTIMNYSLQVLPHVNDLFHFKFWSKKKNVAKFLFSLTLKYDPRVSGWKGDNPRKKNMNPPVLSNIPSPVNAMAPNFGNYYYRQAATQQAAAMPAAAPTGFDYYNNYYYQNNPNGLLMMPSVNAVGMHPVSSQAAAVAPAMQAAVNPASIAYTPPAINSLQNTAMTNGMNGLATTVMGNNVMANAAATPGNNVSHMNVNNMANNPGNYQTSYDNQSVMQNNAGNTGYAGQFNPGSNSTSQTADSINNPSAQSQQGFDANSYSYQNQHSFPQGSPQNQQGFNNANQQYQQQFLHGKRSNDTEDFQNNQKKGKFGNSGNQGYNRQGYTPTNGTNQIPNQSGFQQFNAGGGYNHTDSVPQQNYNNAGATGVYNYNHQHPPQVTPGQSYS